MEILEVCERYRLGTGAQVAEISRAFNLNKYAPGQIIFREGDPSDAFFFIKSGQVLVSKGTQHGGSKPLGVLSEGEFFGEIGLLEDIARTATVTALDDLEVFQLDGERFHYLLGNSNLFSSLINEISKNRLLRQVSIFKELDNTSLLEIQKMFTENTYAAETVILKQYNPPDALYFIVRGGVRISTTDAKGKQITLASLSQGDFFGEVGLIEPEASTFSVTTSETSKLWALKREDFKTLANKLTWRKYFPAMLEGDPVRW